MTIQRVLRLHPIVATAFPLAALLACSPTSDGRTDLRAWTVSPEPTTIVGQMEGDSVYLFQRIRDAAFLPDGRIVVADQGLHVVRVYDSDGAFLAQMGREGEGPGEFGSLRDLWIAPPDTIAVWDSEALRLTYFLADGTLARTVGLEPSQESSGVGSLDLAVGPLADGGIALGSITLGDPRDDVRQDRVSLERFGSDGAHVERIAEVAGFVRSSSSPVPFSPYPYFETHDDAIYFANGESPAVHVWEDGIEPGEPWETRVVAFPAADHDPDAAWAGLRPMLEARNERMWLSVLEQTARSDSIPHLAGLVVDDTGQVWTKRYEAPGDALWLDGGPRVRGGEWWVADPAGQLVAIASVPQGLIPLQVEAQRMLGLTVDELGIERVQVHEIDRGG